MIVRTAILVTALGLLFVGLYQTLAPTRYEAFVRVKLEESRSVSDTNYDPYLFQNEIQLIRSDEVLGKVREKFNLRKNWGAVEKPVSPELAVNPVRCTTFLEIKAAAANGEEASGIANAIVDACQKYHRDQAQNGQAAISMQLFDPAVPPPRASFPNRYLGGASLLLGGLLMAAWWFAGARKAPVPGA